MIVTQAQGPRVAHRQEDKQQRCKSAHVSRGCCLHHLLINCRITGGFPHCPQFNVTSHGGENRHLSCFVYRNRTPTETDALMSTLPCLDASAAAFVSTGAKKANPQVGLPWPVGP